MKEIFKWLDILVPRFIDEWVVLVDQGTHLEPLCNIDDLEEWEFSKNMRFEKCRSFNLFGKALFPKGTGEQWMLDSFDEVQNLKAK